MVAKTVKNMLNSGSYSVKRPTLEDPRFKAAVAKMNRGQIPQSHDNKGNRNTAIANPYMLKSLLQKRAKRNGDAKLIMSLLPDLRLAVQILTSSILSPKDMADTELIYTGSDSMMSSELLGSMINRVKQHFEEEYKIRPKLSEILREVIAEKGSYSIAVIPENAIDDFINGSKISLETINQYIDTDGKPRHLGILGDGSKEESRTKIGYSMEDFKANKTPDYDGKVNFVFEDKNTTLREEYLFVTDNPITLKVPKLNEIRRQTAIKYAYARENISSRREMSDSRIENILYSNRIHKTETVAVMKKYEDIKRKTIGGPLIMKFPSESVIPIFVPGNVKSHIGYFIVLDEQGNPIEAIGSGDYYSGLSQGLNSNNLGSTGMASNLVQKVNTNLGSDNNQFDSNNVAHLDFASKVYADMIERDLISRIKNGAHSVNASLAKNEEIYRIMLSRVLAKKYTQILFLPSEYVTYFAFEYGEDGIGRSMIDDISTICTMRCTLMFSDILASIKNSIGRTKVGVTIPEEDPDPAKSVEMITDEIVRSRQLILPTGVSNPPEIMDFIQRAGFEFEFNGPGLPELKIDFQNVSTDFKKPDSDLQDFLKKSSIMGLGVSPEMVDNGFASEFATTVVSNNIMFAKNVTTKQEIFCPQLTHHCRQAISFNEQVVIDLKDILEKGTESIKITDEEINEYYGVEIENGIKDKIKINHVLNHFLQTFDVTLPKPASITINNQLEAFNIYADALDKTLDAYINEAFLTTTTVGELSSQISVIREMVKSYYLRRYLSKNGFMSELSDLSLITEDGKEQINIFDEISAYIKCLEKSGVTELIKLRPMLLAVGKDLEAAGVPSGDGSQSAPSSDDKLGGFGGDEFGDGGLSDGGSGDIEPDAEPEAEPDANPTDAVVKDDKVDDKDDPTK